MAEITAGDLSCALMAIIEKRRRALGVDQTPLARESGMVQSHYSALKNGYAELDVDELDQLCARLGLDLVATMKIAERATKRPSGRDFTVGGVVETANKAASRSKKKSGEPAAD